MFVITTLQELYLLTTHDVIMGGQFDDCFSV